MGRSPSANSLSAFALCCALRTERAKLFCAATKNDSSDEGPALGLRSPAPSCGCAPLLGRCRVDLRFFAAMAMLYWPVAEGAIACKVSLISLDASSLKAYVRA